MTRVHIRLKLGVEHHADAGQTELQMTVSQGSILAPTFNPALASVQASLARLDHNLALTNVDLAGR